MPRCVESFTAIPVPSVGAQFCSGCVKELGTALGYALLLAEALARMLQAPLLHSLAFGGSTSHLVPLQPQADVFALPSSAVDAQATPLFVPAAPSAPVAAPELCAPPSEPDKACAVLHACDSVAPCKCAPH